MTMPPDEVAALVAELGRLEARLDVLEPADLTEHPGLHAQLERVLTASETLTWALMLNTKRRLP